MQGIHPIKQRRHEMGLTQRQLAKALDVTRETVARWEVHMREVDPDLLPKIAAFMSIPAKDLRPDLAELFKTTGAAQ